MDTLDLHKMPGSLHSSRRVLSSVRGDAFHRHPEYASALIDMLYREVKCSLSVRRRFRGPGEVEQQTDFQWSRRGLLI